MIARLRALTPPFAAGSVPDGRQGLQQRAGDERHLPRLHLRRLCVCRPRRARQPGALRFSLRGSVSALLHRAASRGSARPLAATAACRAEACTATARRRSGASGASWPARCCAFQRASCCSGAARWLRCSSCRSASAPAWRRRWSSTPMSSLWWYGSKRPLLRSLNAYTTRPGCVLTAALRAGPRAVPERRQRHGCGGAAGLSCGGGGGAAGGGGRRVTHGPLLRITRHSGACPVFWELLFSADSCHPSGERHGAFVPAARRRAAAAGAGRAAAGAAHQAGTPTQPARHCNALTHAYLLRLLWRCLVSCGAATPRRRCAC